MKKEDIKAVVENFFSVIERDTSLSINDRESQLRLVLDKLALAIHYVRSFIDETDFLEENEVELEPETRNCSEFRQFVGPNFPGLGYYNSVLDITEHLSASSVGIGDAIDDICDIAADLSVVLWHWDNTKPENALWHFEYSYNSHWGRHLRELQLYLFEKEHG